MSSRFVTAPIVTPSLSASMPCYARSERTSLMLTTRSGVTMNFFHQADQVGATGGESRCGQPLGREHAQHSSFITRRRIFKRFH